jgi:CRISPR-associated endonuclease/helicase Cas3
MEPQHGHLNKVAWWTRKFVEAMFATDTDNAQAARQWGFLAGLWHDLGKFAPRWQQYLESKADPHHGDVTGTIDHSTAGAKFAIEKHPVLGHLLAFPIAGHHTGLLDAMSKNACLASRLGKDDLPEIPDLPPEIAAVSFPSLPPFLKRDGFSASFFTRMLFSSLVDADFLATEAFLNPAQAKLRNRPPKDSLPEILCLVDAKIDSFGIPSAGDNVAFQRRRVVQDCRQKAALAPGIFTLSVPTGGGKTLSSLSFALRHAIAHGQSRVIVVVPFTSIIEQNADVIRDIVAPLVSDSFTPFVEHHSSLLAESETYHSRLAAENWDAPVVITTAVQFFESLFAAKTSRSRKVHHIANAVIILDEAQTLPVDSLAPCLRVLQELAAHYHTSVILCTATQPAIKFHETDFKIGLHNAREIITDPESLFSALKRVELEFIGQLRDAELADRLLDYSQVLCIVNRRQHAQELFRMLDRREGDYHLSALMCPEHRSAVLREVRNRLDRGLPIRLISTQLIEAGVDVDFPVVFRSLAGLDSIGQAAGRCNRNGLRPVGRTFIFEAENQRAEAYFRDTAQIAKQLIDLRSDFLAEDVIRQYFDLYYYQQSHRWDAKSIVSPDSFHLSQDHSLPFKFQFQTVAENFHLIDDWRVPIIIPFDNRARDLIKQLRNPAVPLHRDLLRGLQRYIVQIFPRLRDENRIAFEVLRGDQFYTLISKELNYSSEFGLNLSDENFSAETLIC